MSQEPDVEASDAHFERTTRGGVTAVEAMEACSKPIMISHSFCAKLSPHIRAKTDETLKEPGRHGGLILEGGIELFLDGRRHVLAEGDSLRFASDRPHRFVDASTRPARVIWVNHRETGSSVTTPGGTTATASACPSTSTRPASNPFRMSVGSGASIMRPPASCRGTVACPCRDPTERPVSFRWGATTLARRRPPPLLSDLVGAAGPA